MERSVSEVERTKTERIEQTKTESLDRRIKATLETVEHATELLERVKRLLARAVVRATPPCGRICPMCGKAWDADENR